MSFNTQLFTGPEILPHIDALAKLRIQIFREYPYIYDGDMAYEQHYLNKFVSAKDSFIAVLFESEKQQNPQKDNKVIGALTGLPLSLEDTHLKKPWRDGQQKIENIYYFSEILLLPEYRGKGLGRKLFEQGEAWVADKKSFAYFTLATVIRPNDHQLRPTGYQSLDPFWQRLGYQPRYDLIATIPWQDLNEAQESHKPMLFWEKPV